jgi:hypothetical protein
MPYGATIRVRKPCLNLGGLRPASSSRSVGRKAVYQPVAAAQLEVVKAEAARAVRCWVTEIKQRKGNVEGYIALVR